MKRTLRYLILSLVFSFAVSPACAQPRLNGAGINRPGAALAGELFDTFQKLDLSVEQKRALKEVISSHQDEIINGVSLVFGARMNLFDAVHQEHFDESAVRKASQEAAAAEEQLALLRARIASEGRAHLTPEQKAVLSAKREQMADRVKDIAERVKSRFLLWLSAPVPAA